MPLGYAHLLRIIQQTGETGPRHLDQVLVVSAFEEDLRLLSTLDEKGIPSMVEKTLMAPPCSQFGPISEAQRKTILERSPLKSTYAETVDRESAYELLKKQEAEMLKSREEQDREAADEKKVKKGRNSNRQSVGEAFAKSVARAIGSNLGRQIIRGILGSIMGSKR
jgi:hypothetical protein